MKIELKKKKKTSNLLFVTKLVAENEAFCEKFDDNQTISVADNTIL